ncbi:glycosyltransferase family 2 protein [uncultured Treponema sp.]|uniref:glycosyltransferase family 2 protein n=1 Tax=uncultured Treponema sp. TaxID=162155 RepID=UPI0025D6851B|nr:glycosyltransferase family 2 protein [uncultured Treponema sp.]
MSNEISISVLIPVYNVADKVEKCLSSLFDNDIIEKCEVIVVNDCSTDNSLEIIEDFLRKNPSCKIKLINHKKNMGLACARITAFSAAKGDYVICVDSDDWVEKTYLSDLYNLAVKTNADIVGCDAYVDFPNGKQIISHENLSESGRECIKNIFINKIHGYLWVKMFRRKLAAENNVVWIPNINMLEDVVFDVQLFYFAKKISYIEKPLYHYLQNSGSYMNSKVNLNKAEQLVSAMDFIQSFLLSNNDSELLESQKIEKLYTKLIILLGGTKEVRRKYISIWTDCNSRLKELNRSFFIKMILRASGKNEKLAWLLLESYLMAANLYRRMRKILDKK